MIEEGIQGRGPVHLARCVMIAGVLSFGLGSCAGIPPAQLVVENARIVVGTGEVIERGAIIVRDGRIEAVGLIDALPSAERRIDAEGATVLPGLIDVHRHFLPYSGATSEVELSEYIATDLEWILEGHLTAGLTTVMSPGDGLTELLELRRRVDAGELVGPRLLTAGPVFTAPGDHPAGGPVCNLDPFCRARYAVEVDDPAVARRRVRELTEQGADFIKVAIDRDIVPELRIDDAVLEAITAEADAMGVSVIVHVDNTEDAVRAIALGADKLVHTPGAGSFAELDASQVDALRRVPAATTVSWVTRAVAEAMGDTDWSVEPGLAQMLGNIRYLEDQGGAVAFGTDNPPFLGPTDFMTEVEALATELTPVEVIAALTIRAARYLELDDQLGSIEVGKVADLVVVDGDPLTDLTTLGEVLAVVTAGEVKIDRRGES